MLLGHSSELEERIHSVHNRIAAAAGRAGRNAADIRLVAVTKGVPVRMIAAARTAGLSAFGENRLQEAQPKIEDLPRPGAEWHFLGRIQSNKLAKILDAFDVIQSFSDPGLMREASERLAARKMRRDVLLQVNISGETQKGGFGYPDADALIGPRLEAEYPNLNIRGFMGIGPLTEDADETREVFSAFRRFFDKMRARCPVLDTLSMGMSGDFETAVEEGTTMLRIGTSIFGEREA